MCRHGSQADHPYQPHVVGVRIAVDHQQHPIAACHRSHAVPAVFAAFVSVVCDDMQGIVEDDLGKGEVQAMLAPVGRLLVRILYEPHCPASNAYADVYIQTSAACQQQTSYPRSRDPSWPSLTRRRLSP